MRLCTRKNRVVVFYIMILKHKFYICNGLCGFVFVVVVYMDKDYFLLLKRNLLKNALGAGWGLLRTLRWVGS
jgi:hypothetical protein